MVDDVLFDEFDGDGFFVDTEDAGLFAGRRADAAGEFGEVIGFMEHIEGSAEAALVDEVVPLGDDVSEGAGVVAEGDTAVHTASALVAEFFFLEVEVDFVPVEDSELDGSSLGCFAGDFFESCWLSHGSLS